ncbi:DNA polymerase II [Candidatus Pacearchaeota archaeon]|nr:DNA polymerase II [Candidatus Pacearchaeota archaeon]
MKGYIVDALHQINNGKTEIHLFGRLENGQSFFTSQTIEPYFFIRSSDTGKVKKILQKYKFESVPFTNFKGDKVTKISHPLNSELTKLAQALHKTTDTYEADIKPVQRYLIDNDILGSIEIKGESESSEKIDRIFKNPDIKPSILNPKLKILSIDTESSKKSGNLYCIGLYSENYKKNFIVSNKKVDNAISCKSEAECLLRFREEIKKFDPDIITGWNLIDFDLVFLRNLFNNNKIPFDLGRTNVEGKIRIEDNFFKSSSADFQGRQVLDALNLIKDPFIKEAPSIKNAQFDTYTLEDVSQSILGTGKLIKGKKRHDEIEILYDTDPQKIVDYNLLDCKLVYDIIEKTKIINLAIERSQLTGMPLDKITASIAAFDSLYIREARKRGFVSPTTHYGQKESKIIGGFVQTPIHGIYQNVLVFDFKSLYPSIIKTFNIDPASYLGKDKEKGSIESPNKVYFKNQQGILPDILQKLHEARETAKRESRELANYSIKIIQNSFYGVLASPNCRYFDFDLASSITNFGRQIIQLTAKEIEKKGFKVIYSDTDSNFVNTKLEKINAQKLGKELQDYINEFYHKYVKENYNRKSFLELEFEKLYLSLMFPLMRGKDSDKAAKKRYAGLIEKNGKEELEIVGLEAIRGDWTEAAQDFQREILFKLFHHESLDFLIKNYIKRLKEGELDDKLIYRKSIRKELTEYTKTTPPHVKAARKLEKLDSNIIQYYLTTDGPEPIQNLKHKIDYDHYIEKQIKPIANQVLILLGRDFDSLISSTRQKKLF